MDAKDRYRKFSEETADIPIFSKSWWLDAVAGEENWNVVLVEKGGQIRASMPYVIKPKLHYKIMTMPVLTQTLGPYIKYPHGQKYVQRISYEKEVCNALLQQLPDCAYFIQNFHYSITNWLPFYWANYKQTTRYTYVIENLTDLDGIYKNFRSNIKTDIRKAQKKITVLKKNDALTSLYEMVSMTFERQGKQPPYTYEQLQRLDQACADHNCRAIFVAEDENGQIHSAIYVIWDAQSAYYLIGGGNPKLRSSGANSLLIWEAIHYVSNKTKRFDFEGSMHEPIERFFRAFGAVQKPYYQISKVNSKLLRLALSVRRGF